MKAYFVGHGEKPLAVSAPPGILFTVHIPGTSNRSHAMLLELSITNLALIESLHLELGSGLTVFTGETGAGKSIILNGIGLVLGARADRDAIRTGAESIVVEALFGTDGQRDLLELLEEQGIPVEDQHLVIRREVSEKSSKSRLNGTLQPLGVLGGVGDLLVDIHGQHEHQSLLNPKRHLDLLDSYARLFEGRKALSAKVSAYREALRQREELLNQERTRLQRVDLLEFQMKEVETASPQSDELETLEQERSLLEHAEQLARLVGGAYEDLYESDGAVLENLGRISRHLEEAAGYSPELEPIAKSIEEARLTLEDTAFSLRDKGGMYQADPERLEEVLNRIDLLKRLCKKYGPTLQDVLAHTAACRQELETLLNAGVILDELQGRIGKLRDEALSLARDLSSKRKKAAKGIEKAVMTELGALAMEKARFQVAFFEEGAADEERLQSTGFDRVEFLLSANPGEELRPLARVASGGELSRIMLALRCVLAQADTIPVLVFDEVDAGIGGVVGRAVAERLVQLAKDRQVLCVTHLPQIAGVAQSHFKVVKEERQDGRTVTRLEPLTGQLRLEELARMMSGSVTSQAIKHAEEAFGVK